MGIFLKEELTRYNRQMMLPEIRAKGQEKLKQARVLVIGAGGLGCPVLQYLNAAGVGTIGIVDFDKIELHNLHRQILYSTADVGKSKAATAAEKLKAQNPHNTLHVFNEMLNESNAETLIASYDIVIDGSDNFATRYLVNDTCVKLGKPLVYGTILTFEGQLAVFNYQGGKNLRDVYPEAPDPEDVPSCDENGVLGIVPGIIGTYMALFALQIILGTFESKNQLHIVNLRNPGFTNLGF